MSVENWRRLGESGAIESPCIQVCVIHPKAKLCTGCLRTADEITQWARMSAEDRRAVMDTLEDRRPELQKRRGGRAARLSQTD